MQMLLIYLSVSGSRCTVPTIYLSIIHPQTHIWKHTQISEFWTNKSMNIYKLSPNRLNYSRRLMISWYKDMWLKKWTKPTLIYMEYKVWDIIHWIDLFLLDCIVVSLFVDIFVKIYKYSEKIQITIWWWDEQACLLVTSAIADNRRQ